MRFVNLTPHKIVIRTAEGDIEIEPSGMIARAITVETPAEPINGIPTIRRDFGEIKGLPAPEPDTVYIVSSIALSAVGSRNDVVAPDTGPTAIRDEEDRIVAVTRLVRP